MVIYYDNTICFTSCIFASKVYSKTEKQLQYWYWKSKSVKVKKWSFKDCPPTTYVTRLLVDVLDLVSWLATACCRLFQFQKSTVIMGELQKVCVEKFIFCQALVQSSQDLYKFGPATKELKNILFISNIWRLVHCVATH